MGVMGADVDDLLITSNLDDIVVILKAMRVTSEASQADAFLVRRLVTRSHTDGSHLKSIRVHVFL